MTNWVLVLLLTNAGIAILDMPSEELCVTTFSKINDNRHAGSRVRIRTHANESLDVDAALACTWADDAPESAPGFPAS